MRSRLSFMLKAMCINASLFNLKINKDMKNFETILNSIGALIGMIIIIMILVALTSCSTMKLTDAELTHRNKIKYEIDKVWSEYSTGIWRNEE